jgi:hypothetical protein
MSDSGHEAIETGFPVRLEPIIEWRGFCAEAHE